MEPLLAAFSLDFLLRRRRAAYGGQVSSDGVVMTPDRTLPGRRSRQEETVRKLVHAALETLRETSYADLTVRTVAARAQVAPATAYTYFSSKNHLVAEVYLDLVRQVPFFVDVNETRIGRVRLRTTRALSSLAFTTFPAWTRRLPARPEKGARIVA